MQDETTAAGAGTRFEHQLMMDKQGPRAKYMLYPYYACLIATTAGEYKCLQSRERVRDRSADNWTSNSIHDGPHGARKEDVVWRRDRREGVKRIPTATKAAED